MTTDDQRNRGFTITRRIDAPRELVFKAWTDPEHLRWFATEEPAADNPIRVDLRVGGAWRVNMIESPTKSYMTGGVYREIVPPERLVFTWGAVGGWPSIEPDAPDEAPVVTVTLNDLGDATEMVFHLGFADHLTEEKVRELIATGMHEGWNQTLDRLPTYLLAAAD